MDKGGGSKPGQEDWARCMFWVKNKHRYCKGQRLPETSFCGTHKPSDDRIPCPLDPSHTVRSSDLEKHLKICNETKKKDITESDPFYLKGCNSGNRDAQPEQPQPQQLTQQQAITFAILVMKLYKTQLSSTVSKHHLYESEESIGLSKAIEKFSIPSGGEKHIHQQGGIVGNLRRVGLMDEKPTTVLELGAGRGILGLIVGGVLSRLRNSRNDTKKRKLSGASDADNKTNLIMVDYCSVRRKADTVAREDNDNNDKDDEYLNLSNVNTLRIKCDLLHVNLPKVVAHPPKVLFIAKHLCGAGTDIACRGVASVASMDRSRVKGAAFATCCFGVCSFSEYVGHAHLSQLFENKYGRGEFELLRRWGAMASGSSDSSGKKDSAHAHETAPPTESTEEFDQANNTGISAITEALEISKEELVAACKTIINFGRAMWLSSKTGLKTEICSYCEDEVTPQNMLILLH